jgi:SAM-dependent methyltransferase
MNSAVPQQLMKLNLRRVSTFTPPYHAPRAASYGLVLHRRLQLDLFALDATEYQFEPGHFDLIVMFYHFDRDICPRILAALKPGGFLICKSSLSWDIYEGTNLTSTKPLEKSEILSMFPELRTVYHQERPVLDRGVVEYVGRKDGTSRRIVLKIPLTF